MNLFINLIQLKVHYRPLIDNTKGQKMLNSLFTLFALLIVAVPHYSRAQLNAGPSTSACSPTSCSPACGSSCTYYTCVGPSTTLNITQVSPSIPAYKEASANCQAIITNKYLASIPSTLAGFNITNVPTTITLSSHACQAHTRIGKTIWSVGSFGSCSTTCSGDSGTRTRSVTCPSGPASSCCASKPSNTTSCSGTVNSNCPSSGSICVGSSFIGTAPNGCGYCNVSGSKVCP